MTPRPVGFLALVVLTVAQDVTRPPSTVEITAKLHHLRSGPDREWAEFPPDAEGAELRRTFDATPNAAERTLRIRHRDLKQPWSVALNGREIARLPLDEADMLTFWRVPPGTLREGANDLRIHSTGRASDDVLVGEAAVIDRPRSDVLGEGTVAVSVREAPGGHAVPSRITVANEDGTLVSVGNVSGPQHAVRPGVVYTGTGMVHLELPAGAYLVHAGRGFEYGVASARVTVARGSSNARQLTIRREVDTAGWLAMDTHVHTATYARHGDATIEERMLTIAGEGIELPVSTEHNTRIAFGAQARAAGLRKFFTPLLGSEVTTPAVGHFNVFPLPEGGSAIDGSAPDWPTLRQAVAAAAADPVVVLNHARDVHGGFRPFGPRRHISVAGEDLQGWALPANAMEVVNSGAVMSDPLALPRDWMGLLNRGLRITPVGSSDSHDVSRYIVGQGRTYVRCDGCDLETIDPAEVSRRVRRGQVTVSYGLLVEVEVAGRGPGDMVEARGPLNVRIRVQGPAWTRADRVRLYANGVEVRGEDIPSGGRAGVKWEAAWRLPKPRHDVHLVAIASGPGVAAPYWPTAKPYQPTSIEFTPYVLGVTGAVFVDADGSGSFESAFDYAREIVDASPDPGTLVTRLASYDAAVAAQAASLLRAREPAGFEQKVRAMIAAAAPEAARGLAAYVEAWQGR